MGNGLWLLQYGLSRQLNTMECGCYGMVGWGCEMPWVGTRCCGHWRWALWAVAMAVRLCGLPCLALWDEAVTIGCRRQWLLNSVRGVVCQALWTVAVLCAVHRCVCAGVGQTAKQTDTAGVVVVAARLLVPGVAWPVVSRKRGVGTVLWKRLL